VAAPAAAPHRPLRRGRPCRGAATGTPSNDRPGKESRVPSPTSHPPLSSGVPLFALLKYFPLLAALQEPPFLHYEAKSIFRHSRMTKRPSPRSLVLLLAIGLVSDSCGRDSADHADAAHGAQPAIKIGITLSGYGGYEEQTDAESLIAALLQPPMLRASANVTWSFEFFCVGKSAAAGPNLSASSRASRCVDGHDGFPLTPSVAAGQLYGAWTAGLDRLIALSVPPPFALCEELALKRLSKSRGSPTYVGGRGAQGRAVQDDAGAVCFYLPPVSEFQGASAWPLWHTHCKRHTEVACTLLRLPRCTNC